MASVPTTTQSRLDRLQRILQEDITPRKFEDLAAALISEHLDVGIAVAKSGFQHGGDAGPAGRQGRRFRIETKRYAETTSLSDRELLGEVDHALDRDPALEAWFLMATRPAPEQLELDLMRKADKLGLPIIIVDWKNEAFPTLAALCTVAPDVLERLVSREAADLARELTVDARAVLDTLRRDMEAWNLGFERLRTLSVEQLDAIWMTPRTSVAALGQDAAGGAYPTTIRRPHIHKALDHWWSGRAIRDAPAAVIGWQGAGKTWAVLQWVVDKAADQPMVLVVPSSAVAGIGSVSKAGLKRFFGERLYDLTETRDPQHWQLRLDRLLRRPPEEGPVVTLILDGMNQEPAAPWLEILKVLQGPEFAGRVRTIAITRNLHFTGRLGELRGLVVRPEVVEVDIYDASEGGELDQRLAAEGLSRNDLHEDLISIARTPRLFNLVIRLRERLVNADQVTVHRLLWEYGRDTLGIRAGTSFSEQDWRSWLANVARHRLEGIRSYDLRTLGEMVERPDLSSSDVFRRLSDVIDGEFATPGTAGRFELTPTVVAHALGAALLDHLGDETLTDRDAAERKLADWLDPISGLDEKAEILRAAVSILLEGEMAGSNIVASALVFEWLRSQNLPDQHRTELSLIAEPLCAALLDVVERSGDAALGTARLLAVCALRAISRDSDYAQCTIVERCRAWLSVVPRDVDPPGRRSPESEKVRAARFVNRVGADEDGERTVLGQRLTFVERHHRDAETTIPSLLEGFPLLKALSVFETAALALAIRGKETFWDGLKWLCLLNDRDFDTTAAALRAKATEFAARAPEPGVHAELGQRVGALLLWLSGHEDCEAEASRLNPALGRNFDYERDYLADPGSSLFALEMRHAGQVLANSTIPLRRRVDRALPFLLDPGFVPPEEFCAELRAAMRAFDMNALDTILSQTVENHTWEEVSPVLARCAPDLLASLLRAKLHGLATRPAEQRYVAAIHVTNHYLLTDEVAGEAAKLLREGSRSSNADDEAFVASRLLMLEIQSLPPLEQFAQIIEADLNVIHQDLTAVLPLLTSNDLEELLARYKAGTEKQKNDLILLLSIVDAPMIERLWQWLVELAELSGVSHQGAAFQILHGADAVRFGRSLMQQRWQWSPEQDMWCNHFGSLALASASAGVPFDQLASAIAPWLILRAVSIRSGSAADAEIAAAILDGIISAPEPNALDLGSDISVWEDARQRDPFSFSLTVRSENSDDPLAQFRDAFDPEKRYEARRRAVDTAIERIKEARTAGASLYLHNLSPEDFRQIIEHVPTAITSWTEGLDGPTATFKRRVRLAEGFYLALCESLLAHAPQQGERLWRAIRVSMTARFMGAAGIEQLVHMLFRTTSATEALRLEQLDIANTNSDQELFDFALAAAINDQQAWLDHIIAEDENSGIVWRRQRARKLRGFSAGNRLPLEDAWPSGPPESQRVSRQRETIVRARFEAFARHWWDRYWEAETDEEAYAAWELLLLCVDRRAYLWIRDPPYDASTAEGGRQRRIAHFDLNFEVLKSAMKKQEKKLDKHFLDRPVVTGIGPWSRFKVSR